VVTYARPFINLTVYGRDTDADDSCNQEGNDEIKNWIVVSKERVRQFGVNKTEFGSQLISTDVRTLQMCSQ